jgi:hypothetical protein
MLFKFFPLLCYQLKNHNFRSNFKLLQNFIGELRLHKEVILHEYWDSDPARAICDQKTVGEISVIRFPVVDGGLVE